MNHTSPITIAHIDGSDSITTLAQLLTKSDYTILYFYPKDCTSGCTVEAMEFSQMVQQFTTLGAQVIGVSKDSIKSHHKFISESQLSVDLISDEDVSLHKAFGVRGEKSMYGRSYMWTIRSTFTLDKSCRIITQYMNVTARGHAQQVLNDLQAHLKAL
jgi:peroxiredoxin Q/BCP